MNADFAAAALLLIGIYCVSVKKNMIKIVMGLMIMESGICVRLDRARSCWSFSVLARRLKTPVRASISDACLTSRIERSRRITVFRALRIIPPTSSR